MTRLRPSVFVGAMTPRFKTLAELGLIERLIAAQHDQVIR
jgi:hypothetical protein